jgi:selenocysteine lyase/cysteine desulfurase
VVIPALGDRRGFPDLEPTAYLNHGAISPPSVWVKAAVSEALEATARLGVGAFLDTVEQRDRLRGKLAALIGAQGKDIGFVANTTSGLIAVAQCLDWERGDRIALFGGEFPANITPWQQAARQHGLDLCWLRPEHALEDLAKELGSGLRMVAVSAVQFQTGLRMPIEAMSAMCRAHGAQLCVDAIQAAGIVPLDDWAGQVDYLVAGSHKWLMGTEGLGFVYVHPDRVAALRPNLAGWLSHEEGLRFLFEGRGHLRYDRPIRARADQFEVGMPNVLGCVALEAALDPIQSLGVDAIHRHVSAYLDALEEGLVARGFGSLRAPEADARSGILSVEVPAPWDVIALNHALGVRGVSASTPDGRLRFSPHWPNPLGEVAGVLSALDDACASLS